MASVVAATGAEHGFVDAILDAATRRLSDASTDSTSVSRECALRCFARLAAALDRRLAPWLPGATAAAVGPAYWSHVMLDDVKSWSLKVSSSGTAPTVRAGE